MRARSMRGRVRRDGSMRGRIIMTMNTDSISLLSTMLNFLWTKIDFVHRSKCCQMKVTFVHEIMYV